MGSGSGLLNVAAYYDALVSFLDHAAAEQFVKQPQRAMLMVETSPEALLARFRSHVPPVVDTWLDKQGT